LAAITLLAAGCSRGGSSGSSDGQGTASASQAAQTSGGNFGSLKNVCHGGSASGATDQGVTASQVKVGVLTDVGFTKDPQLITAANVFTAWCNAAGGINGRKLVADVHDTQLLQVVQAVTTACGSDFVLAGGSAALDGLATKTRLQCLLPDFDAQTVMPQNQNSGLQVYPITQGHSYGPFAGYYQWLIKQKYPDSADHVGILAGQSTITQVDDEVAAETFKAVGGSVALNQYYPITGASDWTPYAESLKTKGIKGLVFYGTPQQLAALELTLTNMNYKLDWIDANSNAYGAPFVQAAGKSLSFQHNYADIWAVYPLEKAESNPATQQVIDLYGKYAPGQAPTLQALQAFSAWLIFAASAETCGSNLTRSCVYNAAVKQTAWTGGGLTAPVNLAQPDSPPKCFDIEQATPNGWQAASFGANNGPYRCGAPVVKLTGNFPQPVTLASVGKSLSDLK
jgi:ABC-type branched-subunit amino acid transport system substrate-binding protein